MAESLAPKSISPAVNWRIPAPLPEALVADPHAGVDVVILAKPALADRFGERRSGAVERDHVRVATPRPEQSDHGEPHQGAPNCPGTERAVIGGIVSRSLTRIGILDGSYNIRGLEYNTLAGAGTPRAILGNCPLADHGEVSVVASSKWVSAPRTRPRSSI